MCFLSLFFQNFLDGYVESVDSTYGCVLLRGRVVAATKNWDEFYKNSSSRKTDSQQGKRSSGSDFPKSFSLQVLYS